VNQSGNSFRKGPFAVDIQKTDFRIKKRGGFSDAEIDTAYTQVPSLLSSGVYSHT
jgi:hypothetical protein